MTIEESDIDREKPAAILRDSEGNILATGTAATDAAIIGATERAAILKMRHPQDKEVAEAYVKNYEGGRF